MSARASQITGVLIVYPDVCSGAEQRKQQSSASLTFVRGIHHWPVKSSHKEPVTRKMFPLDDVIMIFHGMYGILGSNTIDIPECFKNTDELLNLRALKFSVVDKILIFQRMGKISCAKFQRYPLTFRIKYLTHTFERYIFLCNIEILNALRFKSPNAFLKRP